MKIRPAQASDIPALQTLLDETELFPSDLLPDMLAPFLANANDDIWLTAEVEGLASGLCFARPEPFADGCWNMLALGVARARQKSGLGRSLSSALEAQLCKLRARVLIVDTSSAEGFDSARAFYQRQGFREEARIEDYWAPGDDKITFWKRLGEG